MERAIWKPGTVRRQMNSEEVGELEGWGNKPERKPAEVMLNAWRAGIRSPEAMIAGDCVGMADFLLQHNSSQ